MIEKIKSIFTIPELRSRITFTLSVLIVVRIGAHIPIPGVDGEILALAFDNLKSGLFGLFNTLWRSFSPSVIILFGNNALHFFIHNYSVNGISNSIFSKITERR